MVDGWREKKQDTNKKLNSVRIPRRLQTIGWALYESKNACINLYAKCIIFFLPPG